MKPKSKYQQRVVELSSKLPAITGKQKQWAYDNCFDKVGYYNKSSVWCLHCGAVTAMQSNELAIELLGDTMICPKCGKKLTLQNSRKIKHQEKWYYTILTTLKGYQVCRHFIVEKYVRKGAEPYISIDEAVQNWIDENGKETVIARPCKTLMGYYDAWDFAKPMEIRQRSSGYYSDKYDINAYAIYPRKSILPIIKRNGYTDNVENIPTNQLLKLLIKDREAEMLIKNKQFSLLQHKWRRGYKEFGLSYPHAIKIANRNKYIVEYASMWFDYLELLEYFNLDTHNAHYVCPRNLKAEHDRLLARKQRIEEKIEQERRMAEARKWEAQYRADKGKYFGICFGNENIIITVIQSVADMAEEGNAMHHCVYTNGYYKNPDSLILSAKDKAGNRIETIEIDLKTYKVIQSRGVCNSNTEHHNDILQLVNDNINLIKRVA
jgi:hypothetical protein